MTEIKFFLGKINTIKPQGTNPTRCQLLLTALRAKTIYRFHSVENESIPIFTRGSLLDNQRQLFELQQVENGE